MKNKTVTYILIAVVGFIWFKVFVRLKDNSESSQVPTNYETAPIQKGQTWKTEQFNLNAKYKDPFLGKRIAAVSVSNNPISESTYPPPTPKIKKEPEIVVWPKIKYYGFVKNNSQKGKQRLILEIDGVIYKLYVNDEILDGIAIKRANEEQISLGYKKQIRMFSNN